MPLDLLPPPVVIVAAPSAKQPRAFTRGSPEGTFATLPRTVAVTIPFGAFAESDALAEATLAARAWSEVPCTAMRFSVETSRDSATSGDGRSHVTFHVSEWPSELVPGALAQTVITVDGQGHITDADVHVNGKDHTFAASSSSASGPPRGTVDLRSILTHELGHVLGLGHSTDPSATMAAGASDTRFRTLELDDENGVCALYPGRGAARCPASACPTGFSCLAGTCENSGTPGVVCAPCVREPGACENAGATARCVDLADGRVCARSCDDTHPCGPGFSCVDTTSAGDKQCVADDGCRALGVACENDAQCTGFVCRGGRCVGRVDDLPDASAPRLDADASTTDPAESTSGCASAEGRSASTSFFGTGVFAALVFVLSARRRRTPR
jgi:hypothetical protein